jgi:CAAX prenyl protease-like protein
LNKIAEPPRPYASSGPWADLGLTLPIFVLYHLGVMFLPVRNAADRVTEELAALAHHDRVAYAALTVGLGALYVAVLLVLGRGKSLSWRNFAWLAAEGVVYALCMRLVATAVVGRLLLASGVPFVDDRFAGLVMSLGAGLYEELVFRVGLYGLGLKLLHAIAGKPGRAQTFLLALVWAVICALVFSAWHHLGALGDEPDLAVFLFRAVCGLVFTLIFAVRGFAPVVWTHVLYDVWVLVL